MIAICCGEVVSGEVVSGEVVTGGAISQGVVLGLVGPASLSFPVMHSRLRPNPDRFAMLNPALSSRRRMSPEAVNDAMTAPSRDSSCIASNTASLHMAALVFGEKPSRYQMSTHRRPCEARSPSALAASSHQKSIENPEIPRHDDDIPAAVLATV